MHCKENIPKDRAEQLAEGVWDECFLVMDGNYDTFMDRETVYVPLTPEGPVVCTSPASLVFFLNPFGCPFQWRTRAMVPLPVQSQPDATSSSVAESLSAPSRPIHNMATIPFLGFPSWFSPYRANPAIPRPLERRCARMNMPRFTACTKACEWSCLGRQQSQDKDNRITDLKWQLLELQVKYDAVVSSSGDVMISAEDSYEADC